MPARSPSLLHRFALALTLGTAFALLYGIAAGWLNEVREEVLAGNIGTSWYESLGVDAEGNPLIGEMMRNRWEYRTLDGESTTREIAIHAAALRARDDDQDNGFAAGWEGRVVPFADGANPPNYWYFIATDNSRHGRGHFIGYNSADHSMTGYITSKGFSTSPPSKDDEFVVNGGNVQLVGELFRVWGEGEHSEGGYTPGKPSRNINALAYPPWIAFLKTGGKFLRIDLAERRFAEALEVDDIISAGQVMSRRTNVPEGMASWSQMWRMSYVIRCPDRLFLIDPSDGKTVDYKLPAEIGDEDFSFYALPDGDALVDIVHTNLKSTSDSHDLVWFNRDGEVTQRRAVAVKARKRVQSWQEASFVGVVAVPAPVVVGLFPFLMGALPKDESVRELIAEGLPALLSLLIFSAGLAFATNRWQRRYRLPRSYGWMAFVFLLGLPGFVGYLLHRRWPVRKLAPPPVPTGLEVFA